MKEYVAKGSLTRSGVIFYITADTLEEAKVKAASGEYLEYDTDGADTVNWDIEVDTVEENS